MKTNQILTRTMGSFIVSQRTSDGMFNGTELLKQWNDSGLGSKKEISDYFRLNQTEGYLKALLLEEDFKDGNSPYLKSRGKYGGTWMHPLLFIDFAMWLNPTFKVKVLKFVYDQLILFRNEAGDNYQELTKQIAKLVKKDLLPDAIKSVARGINYNVFGDHERNIRNKMAEESLMKDLVEFQKKITSLIDEGFLRSLEDVLKYLRLSWRRKYEPKIA